MSISYPKKTLSDYMIGPDYPISYLCLPRNFSSYDGGLSFYAYDHPNPQLLSHQLFIESLDSVHLTPTIYGKRDDQCFLETFLPHSVGWRFWSLSGNDSLMEDYPRLPHLAKYPFTHSVTNRNTSRGRE